MWNDYRFRGMPTITEKENHFIYRMEYHKGKTKRSKVLCEVEWSMHKDCKLGEIRKEFLKEYEKLIVKPEKFGFTIHPSFFYVLDRTGWWYEMFPFIMEIDLNDEDCMPPWTKSNFKFQLNMIK